VTACAACNTSKGGKYLHVAGMSLRKQPAAPRRSPDIVDKLKLEKYRLWRDFLPHGGWL
jgi:hypothetical protein